MISLQLEWENRNNTATEPRREDWGTSTYIDLCDVEHSKGEKVVANNLPRDDVEKGTCEA